MWCEPRFGERNRTLRRRVGHSVEAVHGRKLQRRKKKSELLINWETEAGDWWPHQCSGCREKLLREERLKEIELPCIMHWLVAFSQKSRKSQIHSHRSPRSLKNRLDWNLALAIRSCCHSYPHHKFAKMFPYTFDVHPNAPGLKPLHRWIDSDWTGMHR